MTPEPMNSLTSSASQAFAPPAKKSRPFSLRLTADERAELEARAGSVPLGAFIKSELLGIRKPVRKAMRTTADPKALAQALALLGQSRIASNLNQLAKAANMGLLDVDDDVIADLNEACRHVADIRALLIDALGLKSGSA